MSGTRTSGLRLLAVESFGILAALLLPALGETKLRHIKLAEFVEKSQLIALGQTTQAGTGSSKVRFHAKEILKENDVGGS